MYTFPDYLNTPEQNTFRREESARFIANQPAAGQYYAQIVSDDAPAYFNVSFLYDADSALAFRAWLRQDNFAIMNGAEFEIDIYVEGGYTTQTASFTPDGVPQLTGVTGGDFMRYSARILVRQMAERGLGSEDLILGAESLGGSALLDIIVNIDLPE